MGENSSIEWTDHTFNPWIGCTKVSQGCKNCYAETLMDKRYGRVQWGPQGKRIRTSAANWRKPLQWNKAAEKEGKRARVFCASLADIFEDKADQPEMHDWRVDLLKLIERTPNLDWLLLTKRPENVVALIEYAQDHVPVMPSARAWLSRFPNVWIGTSVENQEQANKRIPELLKIPAAVRFLSMEPLLGPVGLHPFDDFSDSGHGSGWLRTSNSINTIDWVIVGGESGPNARPMNPDWARGIRNQCQSAGVSFFFKQWGEHGPLPVTGKYSYQFSPDLSRGANCYADATVYRVGKHAAGRLLDGREWNEVPAGVRP